MRSQLFTSQLLRREIVVEMGRRGEQGKGVKTEVLETIMGLEEIKGIFDTAIDAIGLNRSLIDHVNWGGCKLHNPWIYYRSVILNT